MRFLVCSDSHGRWERLVSIVRKHPDIRDMLYLGDGISDLAKLHESCPDIRFRAVRGNCDEFSLASHMTPTTDEFTLFGHRVLLLHGHQFAVKGDMRPAEEYAAHHECNLLLYGHTHIAETHYVSKNALHVMNPGSVGHGPDGIAHYGVVDILPEGIVMSLLKLDPCVSRNS